MLLPVRRRLSVVPAEVGEGVAIDPVRDRTRLWSLEMLRDRLQILTEVATAVEEFQNNRYSNVLVALVWALFKTKAGMRKAGARWQCGDRARKCLRDTLVE